MSVYGLQVEVQGAEGLQRLSVAFERGGEAIADFGKYVFPRLVPVFEAAEARQFDAEGAGPTSGAWKPLSPAYEEWKEAHAPGMPILEFSGQLKAALTSSNSSSAYREWSAANFSFGTAGVPWASFHQSGTVDMPARPPFDFDATFETELQRAAMAGLRDAMKAATAGLLEIVDDEGITRQVLTGSRGGQYYINSSGNRTYVKR